MSLWWPGLTLLIVLARGTRRGPFGTPGLTFLSLCLKFPWYHDLDFSLHVLLLSGSWAQACPDADTLSGVLWARRPPSPALEAAVILGVTAGPPGTVLPGTLKAEVVPGPQGPPPPSSSRSGHMASLTPSGCCRGPSWTRLALSFKGSP